MNHGQKPLSDWTEEQKIKAIQDYQEMIGELEEEVNEALFVNRFIKPLTIRTIMNKYVIEL